MSDKRFNLDDARRRLAIAKSTQSLCDILRCFDALLAALGEPEEPGGLTDWIALKGDLAHAATELAEVRRQHEQTREERDRLAKRVAELEERDKFRQYVVGGPVHFAMQQAHTEFEFLVFKLAAHRCGATFLNEGDIRNATRELMPTIRRMVESAALTSQETGE